MSVLTGFQLNMKCRKKPRLMKMPIVVVCKIPRCTACPTWTQTYKLHKFETERNFADSFPEWEMGRQAHHVLYSGQHKRFTSLLLIMSPIVIITIPYTGLSKCNIDIYTLRHWGSFVKSMSEYSVSLVSGISSVDFSLFSLQEAVQKYLWELLK